MKTPQIVTIDFDNPDEMDQFLADMLTGKPEAHQRITQAAAAQLQKRAPTSLSDILKGLHEHSPPDSRRKLAEDMAKGPAIHTSEVSGAAEEEFLASCMAAKAHGAVPTVLPTDKAERKATPLASCLFDYFPAALAEVARISYEGNKQHNGNSEPFWAYDKSMDEADCLLRHFAERGTVDTDGLSHSAKVAWRALALLQRELTDSGKAPMPRAARYTAGEAKAGPTPSPDASYPSGSESELCDQLYAWHKEGAASRRNGGSNPYKANTVAFYAHSGGWLQEDLRQAFIRSSPKYAASQAGRP